MESSPRPGYYPDPSVPGYIRYWDGSQWVAGTSKPMPEGATTGQPTIVQLVETVPEPEPDYPASQDLAETFQFQAIRGGMPPMPAAPTYDFPPVTAGSSAAPVTAAAPATPFDTGSAADGAFGSDGFPAGYARPAQDDTDGYPAGYAAPAQPGLPTPPSMTPVADQGGSGSRSGVSGAFAPLPGIASDPEPGFPASQSPSPFPSPSPSFDVKTNSGAFDVPSGFPAAPGGGFAPQGVPAPRSEPPAEKLPPPTGSALRITLLKPDGKPFDGPVITTGGTPPAPASGQPAQAAADAPWEQRQQARPQASGARTPASKRPGAGQSGNQGQGYQAKARKPAIVHVIAVLAISALGIVPLALMMMSGIQTREDKLALTIKVPTKMNYLDATAIGYLAGMLVVLLGVTVVYRMVMARRR